MSFSFTGSLDCVSTKRSAGMGKKHLAVKKQVFERHFAFHGPV